MLCQAWYRVSFFSPYMHCHSSPTPRPPVALIGVHAMGDCNYDAPILSNARGSAETGPAANKVQKE